MLLWVKVLLVVMVRVRVVRRCFIGGFFNGCCWVRVMLGWCW